MTWNDRPIRTTEAHIRTGAIQPLTAVAVTLPATPSRAEAPLRTIQEIAHHGSAASTLNIAADTLRSSFFMGPPSAAGTAPGLSLAGHVARHAKAGPAIWLALLEP